MEIIAYTLTFPDEVDVLENPRASMVDVADEHIIFDGGDSSKHLCYNTRDDIQPLEEYCEENDLTYVPVFVETSFTPGLQRTRCLDWIAENRSPDWIVQIDSDETFGDDLRSRDAFEYPLSHMAPDIVTIAPYMYWLTGSVDRFSITLSGILDHGRIHRPGKVRWTPTWHEHQYFDGRKLQQPAMGWFHMRTLFVNRLQRQKNNDLSSWGRDLRVRKLPSGVVAPTIHWPPEDVP